MTDQERADAMCWATERAAIIQEGEGCTKWLAELTTAKQRGYNSWAELMRAIKR